MTLVVDASVALKWFVDEEGSEAARDLLGVTALLAPDLLVAEVASGLWRMVRSNRLPPEASGLALRRLPRYLTHLEPLTPLAERAAAIASDLDHPAYDCFYLALAEAVQAPLVTADARLVEAASRSALADWVRRLSDKKKIKKPKR